MINFINRLYKNWAANKIISKNYFIRHVAKTTNKNT